MEQPSYKKITQVRFDYAKAMTGKATNNAKFLIDWQYVLKPNTPYFITFSFISTNGLTIYDGTTPPLLWVDFNTNVYKATASGGAKTDNILGVILPFLERPQGTLNIFYADHHSNHPSYMDKRPNNNMVNIKILKPDGDLWDDGDPADPLPPREWSITIQFTEAEHMYKRYVGAIARGVSAVKPIKKLLLKQNEGTGTSSQRTYNVDMDAILDRTKQYKVGFVFFGAKPQISGLFPSVFLNITWNLDTAYPFNNLTYASQYGILGEIGKERYDTGTSSYYLQTRANLNEPVSLVNWGNNIVVSFLDASLNLYNYMPLSPALWVLMLAFEEI
jgi:hypothetical protein